jgi:hypothetical protein
MLWVLQDGTGCEALGALGRRELWIPVFTGMTEAGCVFHGTERYGIAEQ